MSYELFSAKINALCAAHGLTAEIKHEDGRHIARLSDGYTVTANNVTSAVTFRNRNHCFQLRF